MTTDENNNNLPSTGDDTLNNNSDTSSSGDEPLRTAGIKALEEERQRRRELEIEIKKYSDIDLKEYEELKKEKEQAKLEQLKSEQKYEELTQTQQKTISEKDTKILSLERTILDNAIRQKILTEYFAQGGVQGNSDLDQRPYFDLVHERIKPFVKLTDDGGVVITEADGTARKNEHAKNMSLKELMEIVKNDPVYGLYFNQPGKNGAGIITKTQKGSKPVDNWAAVMKKVGYKESSQ